MKSDHFRHCVHGILLAVDYLLTFSFLAFLSLFSLYPLFFFLSSFFFVVVVVAVAVVAVSAALSSRPSISWVQSCRCLVAHRRARQ